MLQIPASVISSIGSVNYQPLPVVLVSTTTTRPTPQPSMSRSDGSEPRYAIETIISSTSSSRGPPHSQMSTDAMNIKAEHSMVILTTPTPANSGDSGHSSHTSADGNVNVSAAIAANATCQPRLHPKKRKFNPADLEEMEQPTTSNGGNGISTIITSVGEHKVAVYEKSAADVHHSAIAAMDVQHVASHQHAQQQPAHNSCVIKEENGSHALASAAPSIATAIYGGGSHYDGLSAGTTPNDNHAHDGHHKVYNYSKFNRSNSGYATKDTTGGTTVTAATYVVATPMASAVDESLDLKEFVASRVLAKHQDVYVTGAIRSVGPANAILVELDHPEGCRQMYYDILGNGRYDVVSDAVPSANDVSCERTLASKPMTLIQPF